MEQFIASPKLLILLLHQEEEIMEEEVVAAVVSFQAPPIGFLLKNSFLVLNIVLLYFHDGISLSEYHLTLILSHHFQWWTRKGSTDPGRKQRSD